MAAATVWFRRLSLDGLNAFNRSIEEPTSVGLNLAALHHDQCAPASGKFSAAERQQRSRRHAVEDPLEKILHPSNNTRQLKHLQYRAGDLAAV
jgi:hypothetical protein